MPGTGILLNTPCVLVEGIIIPCSIFPLFVFCICIFVYTFIHVYVDMYMVYMVVIKRHEKTKWEKKGFFSSSFLRHDRNPVPRTDAVIMEEYLVLLCHVWLVQSALLCHLTIGLGPLTVS